MGLMFFSLEPDKFFPYTQIDVVQFPSGLGGDDIIEKTFKGPIQQQLRDALQYIRNVVITQKVVKYPDRAESDRFFNYPYAAIEEALSNAVYHRAYDEREPIEVRVENDRIEIVSFPGPDRSVTIEGLECFRVSNRRYRNSSTNRRGARAYPPWGSSKAGSDAHESDRDRESAPDSRT